MRNIHTEVKAGKLIITIDLNAKGELSGSGKSVVIGTTEGNTSVGDVKLGVNCYTTDPKKLGPALTEARANGWVPKA